MTTPRIHIIGGPGSGKSFVAAEISRRLGVPAYDLDDLFRDRSATRYGVRCDVDERDRRLNEGAPMTGTASRVEPVSPPYPPELQKVFDAIMPPGVAPLALFTTLARVGRVWDRFRAGSLLDRGPVSLRHREIVIDRTCVRCGCPYEWGVHVAFFAHRAKLTPEQVRATVHGRADDPAWSDDERLLVRMVDELHDSANLSDALWEALASAFSVDQILELIALVGFYHTVSFFANSLRIPPEPYGVPFPPA